MKKKIISMFSNNIKEISDSDLKVIRELIEKRGGSVKALKEYIRELELENERSRRCKANEKNTISYKLGKSIIDVAKRETGIKTFSKELYSIYVDSLSRKNRDLSNANLLSKVVILLNEQKQKERDERVEKLVQKNYPNRSEALEPPKKVKKVRKLNNEHVNYLSLQKSFNDKNIRIAAIMDEFTSLCFNPEADILHISPDNWESEISDFNPDMLFIESAWKGKDGLWQTKVSQQAEELLALINYCEYKNIRTIFWSKEDPVHFGTFLGVAERVDVVFTTDIDCIQKYKKHLGHDRVYLLCFAAQPKIHNPIEVYERKNKFNFAGSYYLKYPVRQRDFSVLSEVAQDYQGLDIYDRNFHKPHPHYEFPKRYHSMILGSLDPSEIDKAYKGYVYGINMNTIKQSQTMFARRVFEMLASNTIVLSNYSRGTRLLFGDLVICSDEASELKRQLKKFTEDTITQKKYKLQGLRKVLSHHTYQYRLKYILEKSFETELDINNYHIAVISKVENSNELDSVLNSFESQIYSDKQLYILGDVELPETLGNNIKTYRDEDELFDALAGTKQDSYIAVFNPNDSYGEYYLFDLVQSHTYLNQGFNSDTKVITKDSYFESVNNQIQLVEGNEYLEVDSFKCNKSLIRADLFQELFVDNEGLDALLELEVHKKAFSIDCFNYVLNGAGLSDDILFDAHGQLSLDEGVDYENRLLKVAEAIDMNSANDQLGSYHDSNAFIFSANEIDKQLIRPESRQIQIHKDKGYVEIKSTLPDDKHAYIYFKTTYTREEINLKLNSQFAVNAEANMDTRSVFVFLDADKNKLSHHIASVGFNHTMPIPPDCVYIKVGFKVTGNGYSLIKSINIGEKREAVNDLVAKSSTLVLAKQYPAYDDLYKYGFLHSRVRAYKNHNHIVDILQFTNDNSSLGFREFESIDVFSGNESHLRSTLESGQITNIFVHLMDKNMWNIIKDYRDSIKITIWLHGAEIQSWKRREFDLVGLTDAEVERKKKLADNRVAFWKQLINEELNENIKLIFVSNTFLSEVEEDLELTIPADNKMVIHNYVDGSIFNYQERKADDRLKLLSIRPYSGPKYGNDITRDAILELSKYNFFEDLEVNIYGDGEEFDTINESLLEFENVHLHKRFLTHDEIAEAHKQHGVFLNPTRWDSQGVSRDEAMSSGLVVVTNKVAAVPEFISDAEGALFEAEDVESMVERVKEIIDDSEAFLKKSRSANERAKEQCGFETTIRKELDLITHNKS